jgi:hypothetical protein
MSIQALTHHEILGLVEPFSRGGWRVDLGASERLDRRLVFTPARAPGRLDSAAGSGAGLRIVLQFENPSPQFYRLLRRSIRADGVEATLQADGADPGALLAAITAIDPERQFVVEQGLVLAYRQRVETGGLVVAGGSARVADLTLELREPTPHGTRVDLELRLATGDDLSLPDDVLAVLGRDWAPLNRIPDGWKTSLKLRGGEPTRSRRLETAFLRTARHLAATLAEPPRRFHEQRVRARWVVVLRRAIPVLVCLGLIVAAAMVPKLHLAENSGWRMLIFNAPPILMMLFFCLRELPRIEIPPLPRASRAPTWRKQSGGVDAG